MQDINLIKSKLKLNDTYKQDEEISTNIISSDDEDGIKKAYLDEKLSEIEGHFSLTGKEYNEFNLRNDKQSEVVSSERAVKTTIQILYDKGIVDI